MVRHPPLARAFETKIARVLIAILQEVRDPRFIPLTGEFDPAKFRTQYNFIADMHLTELKTLRDNLKRARKMLASSPHDLREEREREVEKLELAVKRSESMVNRDKREKIEQEALRKVTKEEREKRAQGKGDFWIKSCAFLLHLLSRVSGMTEGFFKF